MHSKLNVMVKQPLTISECTKLVKKLKFPRGLVSYGNLHGTVNTTFGYRDASMWTLSILLNATGLIRGIEINSTYFCHTPISTKLNEFVTYDNPKTYAEVMEFLDNLK